MPASVSSDNTLKWTAKIDTGEYLAGVKQMVQATGTVTKETVDGIKKENQERERQLGAMERVTAKLKELRAEQQKSSAGNLPALNREIEAYSKELVRLQNVGKSSFEAQNKESVKTEGILQRLNRAAGIYQKGMNEATNPANIAKYNQRLQSINAEMERLANAGKKGFDDLGRPIEKQLGLIGKLEQQIKLYKDAVKDSLSTGQVELYNKEIVRLQGELSKLKNLGSQGFNPSDKPLKEQLGNLQRLQKAADLYKNAAATATNPELITKYNRKLQETEAQIERTSNIGKKGFDEFGNKIRNSTNLAGKLWGSLKNVANILPGLGIAGLIGLAVEPLIEFIKELDIFKKKISETQKAASLFAEAIGSSEYTSAVSSISELRTNIDLSKKGFLDAKDVVRQYNEGIGETIGQVKTLSEVEAALTRSGDAYVKMTLYKAAANLSYEKAAQKALEQATERAKDSKEATTTVDVISAGIQSLRSTGFDLAAYTTNLVVEGEQRKDKNIKQAQKEQGEFEKIAKDFQKKAAETAKKYGLDFFDFSEPKGKTAKTKDNSAEILRQQESLLKQIASINAEYSRKSLTKDEEELQAVRDKFMKIRAEVLKFNKENPKYKIGLESLNKTEENALADLRYRHETERLKISLEEQKKLYQDYEEYRDTFGEEAARKRYSKDLDLASSYFDKLNEEYYKLNQIPEDKRSGGQNERLKELKSRRTAELAEQENTYKQLAAQLTNYEQQRKLITEKYERERNTLLTKGNLDAIAELDKIYQQDIDNLDDANVQKIAVFKKLFEGVEDISINSARDVVELAEKKLKELVAQGRISKDMAKEIQTLLKTTTSNIDRRLPAALANAASQINSMASAVSLVDKNFGELLGTVGNVIGSVGNLKTSILDIKKAQEGFAQGGGIESVLGMVSGYAGAIGAGVAIAATVSKTFSSIFDKTEEREAARQAQQQKNLASTQLAIEGFNRLIEQQDKAIQKALGIDRIVAYRNQIKLVGTDIQKTIGELNKLVFKVDNGAGRKIDFDINLPNLGDIFGSNGRGGRDNPDAVKLETIEDVLNANRESINKLYTQIEKGLLGETANGTVEQLRLLLSTYEDLEGQLEEYLNRLKEVVTGTSFSSIVDSIAEGFKNGKKYAADFADDFEDLMRTAIIESLKMKALEKPLAAFYDQFATFAESEGGLTASEIAALKSVYDTIITNANAQFEQIKQISGVTFPAAEGTGTENDKALAGRIQGITADQADLMEGRFFGMQISLVKLVEIQQSNSVVLSDFTTIAMDHLNVSRQIEYNTRITFQNVDQTNQVLARHSQLLQNINTTLNSTNDAIRANGG